MTSLCLQTKVLGRRKLRQSAGPGKSGEKYGRAGSSASAQLSIALIRSYPSLDRRYSATAWYAGRLVGSM